MEPEEFGILEESRANLMLEDMPNGVNSLDMNLSFCADYKIT